MSNAGTIAAINSSDAMRLLILLFKNVPEMLIKA